MGNAQALFEAIRFGGDRQNARILRFSFPHDDGPSAPLIAWKPTRACPVILRTR
jgi:hypothetical protein